MGVCHIQLMFSRIHGANPRRYALATIVVVRTARRKNSSLAMPGTA